MTTNLPDKQKCPKCGYEIDTKEIVPDMESVIVIAEKMDYGEPEAQCPNCFNWFYLQTIAKGD